MEEFSWSCLKKTSALPLLKWFSFVFGTGFIILPITIFLKQKLKSVYMASEILRVSVMLYHFITCMQTIAMRNIQNLCKNEIKFAFFINFLHSSINIIVCFNQVISIF